MIENALGTQETEWVLYEDRLIANGIVLNKVCHSMSVVVLNNWTQSKISGVNKVGSQFIERFP